MALYLEGSLKGSGIKRVAIAVLGSIIAAGVFVLGFFALTAAMLVAAVAFLVGAIWWKLSGKKRFQAAAKQAFNGNFTRAASMDGQSTRGHANHSGGRIIEGEVVRRD